MVCFVQMSIIIGLISGEKPIEIQNEVNCCFSILTVGKSKCVPCQQEIVLERLNRLQLYKG